MIELPAELVALPPLALAAGVDLYLTLLFLGAVPATGLWELPLPGALGDLASPGVLVMVGAFYVAELVCERFPPAALVWNAFHGVIRPVSGALLALLLLDGQPLPVVVAGSVAAGVLAFLAHGLRTGTWVLHGFADSGGPSPVLVSTAEDVAVLGAVSFALDEPLWASGASLLVVAVMLPFVPSRLRAFAYAIRLGVARIFRPLGLRRWRRADELPGWIEAALASDEESRALGDAVRGCPAGAWRLEGAPRFAAGWIVVRGGSTLFVFRRRKATTRVELEGHRALSIHDRDLYRRIDVDGNGDRRTFLLVGWGGPGTESLRAELGAP